MRRLIAVWLVFALGSVTPTLADEPGPDEIDLELRALLKQAAGEAGSFHDHFEATVWLTDMSARLADKIHDDRARVELLKHVHYEATRAGVKPELVLAVIEVESDFDPYAISRAGARGLMQVMPFWLEEIGKPGDSLFRVQTNLRYGCTILKYYLDKESGDLTRALARYNGSVGRWVYPNKVYQAFNRHWYPQ